MEDNLEQLVNKTLFYYYSATKYPEIDLKIEFVDDLYSRRLELEQSEYSKINIRNNKEFIQGLNGTIVFGKELNETKTILIPKNLIKNDLLFIGTICHEVTHIHDYISYANSYCDGNINLVDNTGPYDTFYYWTEFHARRFGYFFYRYLNIIFNEIVQSKDEQIEHIKTSEYQLHYLDLHEHILDMNLADNFKIYYIMQYMGRVSAWGMFFETELDLEQFIADYLVELYGPKIIDLFYLLNSMFDFDSAKIHFEELRKLFIDVFNIQGAWN